MIPMFCGGAACGYPGTWRWAPTLMLYSFEYGVDRASRKAGVNALKAAVVKSTK